jgi:hypothetical protein
MSTLCRKPADDGEGLYCGRYASSPHAHKLLSTAVGSLLSPLVEIDLVHGHRLFSATYRNLPGTRSCPTHQPPAPSPGLSAVATHLSSRNSHCYIASLSLGGSRFKLTSDINVQIGAIAIKSQKSRLPSFPRNRRRGTMRPRGASLNL